MKVDLVKFILPFTTSIKIFLIDVWMGPKYSSADYLGIKKE